MSFFEHFFDLRITLCFHTVVEVCLVVIKTLEESVQVIFKVEG